jgi:hypothetical protein
MPAIFASRGSGLCPRSLLVSAATEKLAGRTRSHRLAAVLQRVGSVRRSLLTVGAGYARELCFKWERAMPAIFAGVSGG